jgi:hypothetical protein
MTDEAADKLGAFRIGHDVAGVDELARRIAALGAAPETVRVAIERPDGLLRPGGTRALLERGYAVYPINPKAAERYRERHGTSGAKDDARDARVLAHILRTDGEHFRRLTPEGEVAAELRLTIRAYRELVAEGTRLVNQLHTCLADYYPAASDLFGRLDQSITLDFLEAFPTPEAARAAGREGILAWLKERGYAQPKRADGVAERATARGLAAGAGVVRARRRQALGLVAALRAVVTAKREHERALEEIMGRHPDGGLFTALPGAGTITAAALLGELGEDRSNFSSADALRQVGGTAPVTIQSGKAKRVVRRRACDPGAPRALRDALLQFARTSRMRAALGDARVAWVLEVYTARRKAGDTAPQADRVVANRWAAILWAMWTRREAYDHARYAKARAARALPKAG